MFSRLLVLVRSTMASKPSTPKITVQTRSYPSDDPRFTPPFIIQATQLADSYMLWVGLGCGPESGSLCRDWACAMPVLKVRVEGFEPLLGVSCTHMHMGWCGGSFGFFFVFRGIKPGTPNAATSIFRTASSDAVGVAQRLGAFFFFLCLCFTGRGSADLFLFLYRVLPHDLHL